MSDSRKEYIRADLQRDSQGRLFVRGSLEALDAQRNIRRGQFDLDRLSGLLKSPWSELPRAEPLGSEDGWGGVPKRDRRSVEERIDKPFSSNQIPVSQPKESKAPEPLYVSKKLFADMGWSITDERIKSLNRTLAKYEITTPSRIRHFLSQAAVESEKGTALVEGGSDSYIIKKYADRDDLGNRGEDDALKYRGGGYIQLTGKYNYKQFAEEMNDPRILTEGYRYVAEKYPWEASAFWWKINHMNRLVDNIVVKDRSIDDQVLLVSARVNGFDPDQDVPKSAHLSKRKAAFDELGYYF